MLVVVLCRGGKKSLLPSLVSLLTGPTKHLGNPPSITYQGRYVKKVQPDDYLTPGSELIYGCVWMANRF